MASKGNTDEKVVQLSLDNKEFDSNARKSIQTLDDLKKAFSFEGASKGFEEVERAANKLDLSPIANGIQGIQSHFNVFETMATAALWRVTNQAISTGTALVKSLSVDQITSGWSKFGDKTAAVQTIMAATSKQFTDTGEQMEYVEAQLERLNWFTDETSFRFLDMVNNIGKFTSNAVELDVATTAMQGISTWAARSGANMNEAGRAMYNLSQAIAVGAVKLIDWKSIENANMATAEFKETAIQTAEALGTLRKVSDDTWETLKGHEVSIKNFNENLSDSWFTSEVLLQTLNEYGKFAVKLNELVDETGISTTGMLGYINDYIDGNIDMAAAIKDTGLSAEELTKWLDLLSSEEYRHSKEAFEDAQATKTFAEAIDYVKEAVSSGWMRTFEYIFGNYVEAKELWTGFSEVLYDIFVASGDARNQLLKLWKEMGGRDDLIFGISTAFSNLSSIVEAVNDAFESIFPEFTADNLFRFTKGFSELMNVLTPSTRVLTFVNESAKGLFKTINFLIDVGKTAGIALSPLISVILKIGYAIVALTSDLMHLLSLGIDKLYDIGALDYVYKVVNGIANLVASIAYSGLEIFIETILNVANALKTVYEGIKNGDSIFSSFIGIIKKLVNSVLSLGDGLKGVTNFSDGLSTVIRNLFTSSSDILTLLVNLLFDSLDDTTNVISKIMASVQTFVQWLGEILQGINIEDIVNVGIVAAFAYMAFNLGSIGKSISNAINSFSKIFNVFDIFSKEDKGGFLDNLGDTSKTLLMLGAAIALLTSSLVKLSSMPIDQLITSLLAMTALMAGLYIFMQKLEGLTADKKSFKGLTKIGPTLLLISLSIGALSGSVAKLAAIPFTSLAQGVIAVGLLMAAVSKFADSLEDIDTKRVLAASVSVIALATGLTLMVIPIGILGALPFGHVVQGLIALAAILMEIKVFMSSIADLDVKSLLAASAAMNLMVTAMIGLSVSVLMMGSIPFLDMVSGIAGIAAVLTALVIACRALTGISVVSVLSASIAMTLISTALIGCAAAIMMLSTIDFKNLVSSTIALIALIAALTVSMMGLGTIGVAGSAGILAASVGIVAFAAAMNLLIPPMLAFGTLSWEAIAKGITVLALSMLSFIGAAALAQFVVPGLLALSVAIIALGAGIALAGEGLMKIALVIAGVMAAAQVFGDELPMMLTNAILLIEQAITQFLLFIPSIIPQIALAAASLIAALLQGFSLMIPKIFETLLKLLNGIVDAIVKWAPSIIEGLIQVVNSVTAALPKVRVALAGLFDALLVELILLLYNMVKSLVDTGVAIFVSLFTGKSIEDVLKESGHTVAGYTVDGMVAGIEDGSKDLRDAGAGMYDNVKAGYEDQADINSPSDDAAEDGENTAEGVVVGIESKYDDLYDSGSGAATQVLSGLSDTLGEGFPEIENMIKTFVRSMATYRAAGDYSRYDSQASEGALKRAQENYEKYKKMSEEATDEEKAYDTGFDVGSSFGDGVGDGAGSSVKKKKEKTAEEIVREYAQALSNAYSEGSKYLDIRDSQLKMEETLWNLKHKEGDTDAEKEAYEIAKKQFQIDQMNTQMQNQLDRLALLNGQYVDKLNMYGSGASETVEAFNALISGRLELLSMYNEKMDLLATEVEHDPEAFIAASKEIGEWRELVEQGFITNEQMMQAAKDKIGKVVGAQQHEFENANTELDQKLEALVAGTEEVADLANETWDQLTTDSLKGAISNLGDGAEELAWSMTDTIGRALKQVVTDGTIFNAADGLGANINDGTVNGMETTKKTLFGTADAISQETLDTMADTLGINSPSKYTTEFGEYLDEGLIKGIKNREAKVIEQAIATCVAAIKAAKDAMGIRSPSKETYDMGNYFDQGLANGIADNAKVVKSSIYGMVDNLLNTTESQLAQNGSKASNFLKDLFDLPDEDLHLRVVVDTDSSSLESSMTLLEKAYQVDAKVPAFASVNTPTETPVSALDNFDNSTLQGMYDLLSSYIDFQRGQASKTDDKDDKKTVVNVSMTQNNTSPKPISATDTYRNTQKQLNAVKSGIGRAIKKT